MEYPERGAIYLINFDPTIGPEVKKSRPAVIITNNINNEYSPVLTVIPLSSNTTRVYPFEVVLPAGNGLDNESKMMVNQIRTVDKKRLIKKMSTVSDDIMKKIEATIRLHFDMEY
jgi:mRNA interferase MazF